MKKMKPFKGKVRRFSEGGEAPNEAGVYESGVRVGQNANISDETRQRALDRMEAKRTVDELAKERPAVAKPTVKAAPLDTGDETDRLQKRDVAPPVPAKEQRFPSKAAPRSEDKEQRFPSEPPPRKGTLEDPEYRKTLEKKQALESVHPEEFIGGGALKAARAGATALASGMAAKKAASDIMKRAGERAAEKRAAMAAEANAAQQVRNKRAALLRPKVLRPEGTEKAFRKGGSVRGCGIARKGLTKGTMR